MPNLLSNSILILIIVTSIAVCVFYLFTLYGLIRTRQKTGNTITNGMILERVALVILFAWNGWVAYQSTSPLFVYYLENLTLYSWLLWLIINVLLIISIFMILWGEDG